MSLKEKRKLKKEKLKLQSKIRVIREKVGRSLNNVGQRNQEVYWDEFWMIGLFCMGLNTLNN